MAKEEKHMAWIIHTLDDLVPEYWREGCISLGSQWMSIVHCCFAWIPIV